MAKIRKLYDEAIKPDGTKQVIYPITSTRAVYTTSNITVDAVLGEGYRFGGVVGPTDSPSFLDQRVFYAASIPGVYTNFGGISVNGGEAVFLIYDGISWSKGVFGGAGYSNLSGFVVLDSISELPREKTTLGYLIADESLPVGFSKEILYVWVGEHGDTLDGLYQNCGQLRGASAYEVAVWNGYEGTQEEWLNDPVNGIKGISVQSFEIEGEYNPAESAVNTYKVTLSNGDSLEMPIKNGSGIKQIEAETISYENGGISTYKITLSDNREYTFQVRNGKTSCGLFGTAEALAEKYPNPEVGDYAFVGSAFPALIYVCNTAGEWTNTEETYDGDNVDLTEYAKSEDVGYYIQNPEYVRVYTDAEDKILWGIKADGTIYFGAGVPPQIVDYVEAAVASVTPQGYEEVLAFLDDAMATDKTLAQLLAERDEAIQAVDGKIDAETLRATEAEEAKVDKVEGESLVNSDFANGIQYIDNPEFVEVKVDSEDKILEGIKSDGTKVIGADLNVGGNSVLNGDLQVLGSLDISGATYSLCQSPEWIKVLVDSQERIIAGVRTDGTCVCGAGFESALAYIQNLTFNTATGDTLNLGILNLSQEGQKKLQEEILINTKDFLKKQEDINVESKLIPYVRGTENTAIDYSSANKYERLVIAFMTDNHIDLGDASASIANVKDSIDFINNLHSPVAAILEGGDLITALYSPKSLYKEKLQDFFEMTWESKIPFLYTKGNHDINAVNVPTSDVLTEDDWNEVWFDEAEREYGIVRKTKSNGKKSGYYYYDLDTWRVRIICVDCYDLDFSQTDEQGKVLYTPGAASYIANEQFNWIANTALNFDDKAEKDWGVIIFTHFSDNPANEYGTSIEPRFQNAYAPFNRMLVAFNSQDSFNEEYTFADNSFFNLSVNADWSRYSELGKKPYLIAVISGHRHWDYQYNWNGVQNIFTANQFCGEYASDIRIKRVAGTKTQNLFDLFVIDLKKKKIRAIRYGAGVNCYGVGGDRFLPEGLSY